MQIGKNQRLKIEHFYEMKLSFNNRGLNMTKIVINYFDYRDFYTWGVNQTGFAIYNKNGYAIDSVLGCHVEMTQDQEEGVITIFSNNDDYFDVILKIL